MDSCTSGVGRVRDISQLPSPGLRIVRNKNCSNLLRTPCISIATIVPYVMSQYVPAEPVPPPPTEEVNARLNKSFSLQQEKKFDEAIRTAQKAKEPALVLNDATGDAQAERMSAWNLAFSSRFVEVVFVIPNHV
jgi:hypothetical protein